MRHLAYPFAMCVCAVALWGCSDDDSSSGESTLDGGVSDGPAGGSAGMGGSGHGGSGGSKGGSAGSAGAGGTSAGGAGGSTPTVCNGNCHYVSSNASGSGDGSDWTNAYLDLPADLQRGHVYFVAAGQYAGAQFDDVATGDTTRILRATLADHGTDVGWSEALGTGEATFGPLQFSTADWEIDGRGAIRVIGEFQGTVVEVSGDRVEIRNLDVDGSFQMSGDQHVAGSCSGMEISSNNVVVSGTQIHDTADDGVSVGGSDQLLFVGNRIFDLHGCGTDGGCGPCYNGHSDGLEIYNVKNSEFVGNWVYNIPSTSTFFFGDWADELGGGPSEYCENILLANNVLYNWDTGFVAYIEDANGVRLYNNTIWGQRQGAYGGLAIGRDVTGLSMVNNIILSVNFAHMGGAFDAARHSGDYNFFGSSLGQWQDAAHDVVGADPGFTSIPDMNGAKVDSPAPEMFIPRAGSPVIDKGTPGDASTQIPATDFFGKARDQSPNMGAME